MDVGGVALGAGADDLPVLALEDEDAVAGHCEAVLVVGPEGDVPDGVGELRVGGADLGEVVEVRLVCSRRFLSALRSCKMRGAYARFKIQLVTRPYRSLLGGGDDERDDEAVESESFSENEDEDHSDEEGRLLGVGTDSGVSDDSDGEAGGKTGESAAQTGTEMGVSLLVSVVLLDWVSR